MKLFILLALLTTGMSFAETTDETNIRREIEIGKQIDDFLADRDSNVHRNLYLSNLRIRYSRAQEALTEEEFSDHNDWSCRLNGPLKGIGPDSDYNAKTTYKTTLLNTGKSSFIRFENTEKPSFFSPFLSRLFPRNSNNEEKWAPADTPLKNFRIEYSCGAELDPKDCNRANAVFTVLIAKHHDSGNDEAKPRPGKVELAIMYGDETWDWYNDHGIEYFYTNYIECYADQS